MNTTHIRMAPTAPAKAGWIDVARVDADIARHTALIVNLLLNQWLFAHDLQGLQGKNLCNNLQAKASCKAENLWTLTGLRVVLAKPQVHTDGQQAHDLRPWSSGFFPVFDQTGLASQLNA